MSDDVQRHILLVEDEESLILTLQDRLESERYEVTVARDGEAALETGSRKAFDCIVLDVALPRKNGFDVCRDLRNRGVLSSCSPRAASSSTASSASSSAPTTTSPNPSK